MVFFKFAPLHPQFFFRIPVLLFREPSGFHKGQQHGFLIFVQELAVCLAGDPAVIFDAFQCDRFYAASPPFCLNLCTGQVLLYRVSSL